MYVSGGKPIAGYIHKTMPRASNSRPDPLLGRYACSLASQLYFSAYESGWGEGWKIRLGTPARFS